METSQKDSLQQHKVLVANRGEIAIRIMRACRKLGVAFTAIFTAEDAASGHVRYARENGGERSLFRVSSYHDANELMSVADQAGCTAVHPGYGFFAEDFRFARRVTRRDRKMIFIGPSWKIIRELGDKINTKRLARSLDVPTVPGSDRPIYDEMEAERIARSVFEFQVQQGIKRPLVLVKASAGGGGMGIEEVYDIDNFRSVYRRIRNYALRQFKDEGVLIEQRITTSTTWKSRSCPTAAARTPCTSAPATAPSSPPACRSAWKWPPASCPPRWTTASMPPRCCRTSSTTP